MRGGSIAVDSASAIKREREREREICTKIKVTEKVYNRTTVSNAIRPAMIELNLGSITIRRRIKN